MCDVPSRGVTAQNCSLTWFDHSQWDTHLTVYNVLVHMCVPSDFDTMYTSWPSFPPPNSFFYSKKYAIGLVWFGLCCLMTPGLSKDIPIRCYVWPYFSKLANHQIRHRATHKVSLVIAYGHFNLPQGLCGYVWVNILTLSPPRWCIKVE